MLFVVRIYIRLPDCHKLVSFSRDTGLCTSRTLHFLNSLTRKIGRCAPPSHHSFSAPVVISLFIYYEENGTKSSRLNTPQEKIYNSGDQTRAARLGDSSCTRSPKPIPFVHVASCTWREKPSLQVNPRTNKAAFFKE
jgi:hypothetical protein